MTDERMTLELRELERWFSSHPQPDLETASRDVFKAVMHEALNAIGLCDPQVHEAPDEMRQRLKAAVRRELAAQESGATVFPLYSLRRPAPWLSSAAALIFVVLGFGLLGRNVPPIADDLPIDRELASIGAELAYLELQSIANDFVFFGSSDVDRNLRDDIERTFLPSLYLESADDDYQEGVSQ